MCRIHSRARKLCQRFFSVPWSSTSCALMCFDFDYCGRIERRTHQKRKEIRMNSPSKQFICYPRIRRCRFQSFNLVECAWVAVWIHMPDNCALNASAYIHSMLYAWMCSTVDWIVDVRVCARVYCVVSAVCVCEDIFFGSIWMVLAVVVNAINLFFFVTFIERIINN